MNLAFSWQIALNDNASEIFWGDVKINALKGGCKQNGNDYTIFPLSNS